MASLLATLRRRYKAWLCAFVGGGAAFLLMASPSQLPHGALIGLGAMLVCIAGLLSAMGLFEVAPQEQVPLAQTWLGPRDGEPRFSAPMYALPVAFALFVLGAAVIGGHALPWAVVLGLLWLLPAARTRAGLLVFVVGSALYLPLLGGFGLWDPWETHYGEVAREILSRDDWISLWWAQERWFWSKPIYIFWSEALTWSASGIDFRPDSNFQHIEWVMRLPVFAVAITALLALYAALARAFSPRTGVLAAIVLATMPYFGFLSHQAITDMPFVGNMTVAVALFLLALSEEPERVVRGYRVGPVTLTAQHAVLGGFLLLALPQVLYLASRNVSFLPPLFAWHRDAFVFGSPGNADVPGNFVLRDQFPSVSGIFAQPLAQALYWSVCIAVVCAIVSRERRAQSLYMFGFYLFCALAFMAKGIPGFALPGLFAALYLLCENRWSELLSGRFRVASGALMLATVGMPWFVAMYMRHGKAFTDRLLVHDHINRLTSGVHGDTGDIQYFIQQFGYGAFPWIALVPAAAGSFVLWSARRGDAGLQHGALDRQRQTIVVFGLWFAAAFTLFSAMTTKFHHYIFPATPAAAALIGVFLDDLFGAEPAPASEGAGVRRHLPLVAALVAPLPLLLGAAGLFGDVRGIMPKGLSSAQSAVWALQHPWPGWLCALLLAVGAALLFTAFRLRQRVEAAAEPSPPHAVRLTDGAAAAALLAAAVLCAFVGRDLSWTTAERPAGSERLVQLFIYKYERPFPDHIDYRAIFTGFTLVGAGLFGLAAVRRLRPVMLRALVGYALIWSLFCLDVYMIDLTPHWTQQNLAERYYRLRKSPSEPLVAWQMNWKGENLYTGNHVAVFVDLDNKKIKSWIDDNKGTTAFFVLEHSRLERFKKVVAPRDVKTVTSARDNNKFVLVRVAL